MRTHEQKINRILMDAFEKGLIEPTSLSPAELGKAIQEEYEANPPSLKELVGAHLYAFQLSMNRKK